MESAEDNHEVLDLDQIEDIQEENTQHQSNCLVGKLQTEKSANSFAIMDVMKKAWRAKKGLDAREWTHNLFLFRFTDQAEMTWVIKNQPWHFEGHLFTIRPLKEKEQPSKIQISEAQLWVRVYDAPVDYMTATYAKAMAKKLGALVAFDPSLDFFGKYIRMKVEMNISKPLKRGLAVVVGGEQLWLPLKYEGLPLFCYNCGMIGHTFKACEGIDHLEEHNPQKLPFGPDIKASPLKKIHSWSAKTETKRHSLTNPLFNSPAKPATSSTGSHISLSSSNRNQKTLATKKISTPSPLAKDPLTTPTLDPDQPSTTQNHKINPNNTNQQLMDLDCLTPTPLVAKTVHQVENNSSSNPHHPPHLPLKAHNKKQWKKLARSKTNPKTQSLSPGNRGKRLLDDGIQISRGECTEAKRLKLLTLKAADESTAETAQGQSRRSK